MDAFALYRLPHADHCSMVCQDGCPATLSSVEAIGSEPGFVIAPFTVTDDSPIVMLRPDQVCVCTLDEVAAIDHLPWYLDGAGLSGRPASRDAYHQVFGRFHRVFSESGIQKLVLARCADVEHHGTTHPVTLFVQACKAYPEAFVTLFSAPQCGTWLVATPEVLLSCHAGRYHTMALAGTMRATGSAPQWSDKNLHEQQYVAQYIESCLARYSDDIQADGPYTTRAGILEHLRTDFAFTLTGDTQIGAVLHALHPTPAVCGVPKREAHQFILDNEDLDRRRESTLPKSGRGILTAVITAVSRVLSTSMATLPCLSRCAACASWTIVIACLPVEESCRRVSNRWSGTRQRPRCTLCCPL